MCLILSLDIYLPILHKMLNPDMEKLLSKCGKWTHLAPDILLEAKDLTDPSGPALQGNVTGQEVGDAATWLVDEPLMTAMQDITDAAAVRCRHSHSEEMQEGHFGRKMPNTSKYMTSGHRIDALADFNLDYNEVKQQKFPDVPVQRQKTAIYSD